MSSITMPEEKIEYVRAYDREWHKIRSQECNIEDCCYLDLCDISDENVEIHCRELKQYAIQIETGAKVYGFQDEDFVFDSDSKNEEYNPNNFSYGESDEGNDVLQDLSYSQNHEEVLEEEGGGSFGSGYRYNQCQNCLR